jgi:hypothetical protein
VGLGMRALHSTTRPNRPFPSVGVEIAGAAAAAGSPPELPQPQVAEPAAPRSAAEPPAEQHGRDSGAIVAVPGAADATAAAEPSTMSDLQRRRLSVLVGHVEASGFAIASELHQLFRASHSACSWAVLRHASRSGRPCIVSPPFLVCAPSGVCVIGLSVHQTLLACNGGRGVPTAHCADAAGAGVGGARRTAELQHRRPQDDTAHGADGGRGRPAAGAHRGADAGQQRLECLPRRKSARAAAARGRAAGHR